jgi:arylsulfatase A-like enzyme
VEASRPELVSFYDVLPSLCELAGAVPPASGNLCGRSYVPLALNRPLPKKEPWGNLVFGHFRNTEMARDNRFKLVLRNGGEGPNELFDLSTDPREKVDHYGNSQYITVRDRLAKALEGWRKKYA